jgi:hypothetical protein
VKQSYWNSLPLSSQSQGSMQIMDNGRVFVGYGYIPTFTEYSADGEVLCDVHFGPESGFGSGDILSYRAFKRDWIGKPTTVPNLVIESNITYVSWNGATEVATWVLEGAYTADAADEDFNFLASVVKNGFETGIQLPEETHPFIRVAAVDADGYTLAHTDVVKFAFSSLEDDHPTEDVTDGHIDDSAEYDHVPEEASTEETSEEATDGEAMEEEPKQDFSQIIFFLIGFVTAVILAGFAMCIFRNTSYFRSRGHTAAATSRNGKHEWDSERDGGDEEEGLAAAEFSDQSEFSDEETEFSERKSFSDETTSPPPSPSTLRYNGEI